MNTLYRQNGRRKYLTRAERDAFLKAADDAELREVRTLCATLADTGFRISEALALTADGIDLKDGAIVIERAKKRRTGVYRPVPVPPAFLDAQHGSQQPRGTKAPGSGQDSPAMEVEPHKRLVTGSGCHEGGEGRRSTRHAQVCGTALAKRLPAVLP